MRQLRLEELWTSKILVRTPNWVGDAVMCLPALRALRAALPQAELVLLSRPWVRDIFACAQLSCRIWDYDTRGDHRGLRGRWRMGSALRSHHFGAAILFQNAFDAALIALLGGIPYRAGYMRQGRGPLLTHPVGPPRRGEIPAHEAHYYLELLRRLKLISAYPTIERIELPAADESREASRNALLAWMRQTGWTQLPDRGNCLVGISPGAAFGTAKRWPAARFAELACRLKRELGASCVFFGSREEQVLADSLAQNAQALSLAGRTSLADFMHLVRGCDLYITNDTGTMHLAAALAVPTLAIFGPTNENETRPLGRTVRLVVGTAFCRPCKLRHCPIDHRCMNSISVEIILAEARRMLESQAESDAPAPAIRAHSSGTSRQEVAPQC